MTEPSKTALLLAAIGVLGTVIGWLVVKGTRYIKQMHKKHEERLEALMRENWARAETMVAAVNNLAASDKVVATSLDNNTKAMERTGVTISDLHKYIIGQQPVIEESKRQRRARD